VIKVSGNRRAGKHASTHPQSKVLFVYAVKSQFKKIKKLFFILNYFFIFLN
jgi:hypothetical protein